MTTEYLEPTPLNKKKAIILTVFGVAFFVANSLLWPPLMAFVGAKPLCEKVLWLQGLIIFFGLVLIPLSFIMFRRVLSLSIYNQTPLPTDAFFKKQKVHRDWHVKLEQAGLIFVLLVFLLGYIFMFTTSTVQVLFENGQICKIA
ncbi:MAG: hypothetical protein DBP02_19625 [gamma proteobacterium symbiont of Ctena orbiculata]|nr:MAG: hypothetical protein DBP02_19625 [gamma proteobacterium symbiont of Ctena orbiculata]